MSSEAYRGGALVETARLELDRAHRGAMAMDAGEMRRGLQLALTALQEAAATDAAGPLGALATKVATALADLDGGSLTEMESLIESVRMSLDR